MMLFSPHINVELTFALASLSDDPAKIGDTIRHFIVDFTT